MLSIKFHRIYGQARQFPRWTKLVEEYRAKKREQEYKIFVSRVTEAVEKGELDPFRIKRTYRQWQKNHPDMPSDPHSYYRGQFPGWNKLLGREKVEYESFVSRVTEAVEKGELDPFRIERTYRQWQKNHPDMPSDPRMYYGNQFPGWTKFLGRGKVEYESFVSRVLEAVEKGELDPFRIKRTYRQWQKNHPDMPSNPPLYYRGQFPGWTKLLGRGKVEYESFVSRVLEAVEKGELDPFRIERTYRQWQKKNHPDMPSDPRYTYGDQFPGWTKLLGREKVEYESFVSRVLEAVEKGELDPFRIERTYRQWQKNHPDIPSDPRMYYGNQFPGWTKFLERKKMEYVRP